VSRLTDERLATLLGYCHGSEDTLWRDLARAVEELQERRAEMREAKDALRALQGRIEADDWPGTVEVLAGIEEIGRKR
jgi:hypothetical protein